jgi:filamentous hemagglutinin family protein
MNKIHRVLWNEALGSYVAVPETAKTGGAGASAATVGSTLLAVLEDASWSALKPLMALLVSAGLAHAGGPAVNQLPQGGQVAAGVVNIRQNAGVMDILQNTDRAVVNWQSFDVGASARVNFNQPQASSVILNRVLGSAPSQIYGQINANGQVFLTNPSGVYFSPGSSVDVGALTATTHSIKDTDFMAGKLQFERNGATGSVVNEGTLRAQYGGYIALLAPEVRNQGLVVAKKGTVVMAAGDSYQLQIGSDGNLSNVLVTPATIAALVENGNAVEAPGGLIILSAQAASRLQAGVVKNSGVISSTGLVRDGGVVRLVASDRIQLTGSISADAAPGSAGSGGRIEVIADLANPASVTQVDGTLSAKGGNQGGDGGFIETSAARLAIADGARVNTLAPRGLAGNWLLDPNDFEVSSTGNITGSALTTLLGSSNVTLQAGTGTDTSSAKFGNISTGTLGNINIYDAVSWSANTLTLNAGYNINVGSSSKTGSLTVTGSGALALNPSSSLVTGYTTGGMVLMGMAATPTGGPNTNGFNGSINLSATDATRLTDVSLTPVLKISGNTYNVIKTLGTSTDYYGATKYTLQGMANGNLTTGKYFALGKVCISQPRSPLAR